MTPPYRFKPLHIGASKLWDRLGSPRTIVCPGRTHPNSSMVTRRPRHEQAAPKPRSDRLPSDSDSDDSGAGAGAPSPDLKPDKLTEGSDASDESSNDNSQLVKPQTGVWTRPDGRGKDPYPGWQRWSKNHWAWEFLRRNETFKVACDDLSRDRQDVADEFGLRRFKDYRHNYETEPKARFVTSITSYPKRSEFVRRLEDGNLGSSVMSVRCAANEVLFKVPLALVSQALKTSIAHIAADIEKRIKDFNALLPDSNQASMANNGKKRISFHKRKAADLVLNLTYLDRHHVRPYPSDWHAWTDIDVMDDHALDDEVTRSTESGQGRTLRMASLALASHDYRLLAMVGIAREK